MEYSSKRFSMNTNLKNARIFDEDSWDAESAGLLVKKEPENSKDIDSGSETSAITELKVKPESLERIPLSKIKKEPESSGNHELKTEEHSPFCNFGKNIKKEPVETEQEHESVDSKFPSTPIKSEFARDESNPSPFNKELFKHFSLDSPQTKENSCDIPKKELRTTATRTVFKQESPETATDSSSNTSKKNDRISARDRLGPKVENDADRIAVKRRLGSKISSDDDVPSKKSRKVVKEFESDPEVLSRRQKQIDYGKNTLGYDQYITKVPRDQRSQDDPQTPNKYLKYSRRGWDGLIKQWRLKLHQYDPKDS
ncbi:hypothetical protein JTB14_001861 [Gonioctena quinquepunctata]|nr:hypothetical protein JTB14_001861 [Gonioctena quinquepunctata]